MQRHMGRKAHHMQLSHPTITPPLQGRAPASLRQRTWYEDWKEFVEIGDIDRNAEPKTGNKNRMIRSKVGIDRSMSKKDRN